MEVAYPRERVPTKVDAHAEWLHQALAADPTRGRGERHPLLRRHLHEHFVAEVGELADAVFVGLGPQVQMTLDALVAQRILPRERVIAGMLHPSGNCTYRINYLIGDRSGPVPHATNPVPYDEGRRAFRRTRLGTAAN